jgi:hypothetical protein
MFPSHPLLRYLMATEHRMPTGWDLGSQPVGIVTPLGNLTDRAARLRRRRPFLSGSGPVSDSPASTYPEIRGTERISEMNEGATQIG